MFEVPNFFHSGFTFWYGQIPHRVNQTMIRNIPHQQHQMSKCSLAFFTANITNHNILYLIILFIFRLVFLKKCIKIIKYKLRFEFGGLYHELTKSDLLKGRVISAHNISRPFGTKSFLSV